MKGGGQRPASPAEAWISDGGRVLHFRPARWDRWRQSLEVTSGEWIPGQAAPLLKHRQELSRKDALDLWRDLRRKGWVSCAPQWTPPAPPATPPSPAQRPLGSR